MCTLQFPSHHNFEDRLILWKENIGDAFKEDCGADFEKLKAAVEKSLEQLGGLEKNILAIAEKVSAAKEMNIKLTNMEKMVQVIGDFCVKQE